MTSLLASKYMVYPLIACNGLTCVYKCYIKEFDEVLIIALKSTVLLSTGAIICFIDTTTSNKLAGVRKYVDKYGVGVLLAVSVVCKWNILPLSWVDQHIMNIVYYH